MSLRITLESLSPVSWGDAERRADPLVVRIPSIRGTVRKWYRWYLASLGMSHDQIRTQERKIFGGVHDKPSASRVKMRFESLEVLKSLRLGFKDPFLWPLRWGKRNFYMVRFDLVLEKRSLDEDCKDLLEAVKALALSVTLGGFGYRSNRGYGSFAIYSHSIEVDGCEEEIERIIVNAERATRAPLAPEWEESAGKLLNLLGIKSARGSFLPEIQSLSNAYLLHRAGFTDWKDALRDAQNVLRQVERSLRFGGPNKLDYRVLLGSPVLGRRRYVWRDRRASPLLLGMGGSSGGYLRGVLFISRDYPNGGRGGALGHFRTQLAQAFERILDELGRFFIIKWVGDLL